MKDTHASDKRKSMPMSGFRCKVKMSELIEIDPSRLTINRKLRKKSDCVVYYSLFTIMSCKLTSQKH